jgi:hypothetical protein
MGLFMSSITGFAPGAALTVKSMAPEGSLMASMGVKSVGLAAPLREVHQTVVEAPVAFEMSRRKW